LNKQKQAIILFFVRKLLFEKVHFTKRPCSVNAPHNRLLSKGSYMAHW